MKRTLIMVIILTTLVFAETGKQAWMNELGLSDAQKEKIDELSTQWQKDKIDLEATVKKAEISVGEVMKNKGSSRDDLEKVFENLTQARLDFQRAQFNHILDVRDELTDAQKENFTPNMGGIMRGQHRSMGAAGQGDGQHRSSGMGSGKGMGSGMHEGCGKH